MNKIPPDDRQFPEQGMTFIELAQYVIPGLSEEDAETVLWECTSWPLSTGRDTLMPELEKVRDQFAAGMDLEEVKEEIYRKIDEEVALHLAEVDEEREPRTIVEDFDLPGHVVGRPIETIRSELL